MAAVSDNKPGKQEVVDKRTADEKTLFELIEKGNTDAVIAHVQATKIKIDCLDTKGMTPLQYACFRGNKQLCEFFLANGADVNANFHENSYSALMFAALSGNKEVTRLMLEAGANVNHTNSVNRTAAQMAAFVGQHQVVSVINNFFPKQDIDYYTKPQGLEKEAKLPAAVAPFLCELINFTNLHPVKISLYLRDHPQLLAEHKKVCLVLSRLVEKNMKSRETNDVLAIKCHFISTVIKLAAEAQEKDKEKSLNSWIKALLKGREEDGFLEFQERLVRQSLKEFPYVNSALLQQLVRQIAPVKIGSEPTAFSMMTAALNGQQFAWEAAEGCDTCGEPKAKAKCSKCKMVAYCNSECQRLHWPTHKKFCDKLADQFKKQEELRKAEEQRLQKMEAEQQTEHADKDRESTEDQHDSAESSGKPEGRDLIPDNNNQEQVETNLATESGDKTGEGDGKQTQPPATEGKTAADKTAMEGETGTDKVVSETVPAEFAVES